jgi:ABC-type transport system involved in Fe-S cluster assembly fused permease/ATPase subunit
MHLLNNFKYLLRLVQPFLALFLCFNVAAANVQSQLTEKRLAAIKNKLSNYILKRPPILVFDEATSSLDSQSEQAILSALREISQGHTSLVIAHRLSTIVDADSIVVMGDGEIIEQGNHQQLLAANGAYKKLWQTQHSATKAATEIDI